MASAARLYNSAYLGALFSCYPYDGVLFVTRRWMFGAACVNRNGNSIRGHIRRHKSRPRLTIGLLSSRLLNHIYLLCS